MALEKISVVDKVEVVENGTVQVRTATRIVEDGNVISTSYHRHTIAPGQDYSAECDKVKAICAATHTAEVVSAYQAMLEAQRIG
jgi:archaellum component FlaF (FlaF/FlaG flagellin family)